MPSTFSSNLGLELPATGEQAGTWGTTMNLNLGTLLDQAIGGFTNQLMTDGADTVITIPNGAYGVARNMFIQATGTLTGDRNLVVPAQPKLYFIGNATSGGYAITVKCAGQTGVSVPSGKWMAIGCYGADTFPAIGYVLGDISGNAATATNATNATNATYAVFATSTTTAATCTGNAATVTNGLYSSQSYANPTWLTSLAESKISGSLAVARGGTGGNDVSTARTNLGVPSLTGTGASGTWGINITGNAATASSVGTYSSFTGYLRQNDGNTNLATGTVYYTKIGNVVTMTIPEFAVTSTVSTLILQGIPADLRPPSVSGFCPALGWNAGSQTLIWMYPNIAADFFTLYTSAGGGFTNTATTKGIRPSHISYHVI